MQIIGLIVKNVFSVFRCKLKSTVGQFLHRKIKEVFHLE